MNDLTCHFVKRFLNKHLKKLKEKNIRSCFTIPSLEETVGHVFRFIKACQCGADTVKDTTDD